MRLLNRPLALVLAAALAVAAVLVIIEVITVALGHGPLFVPWTTWYRWAHRTRWDQAVIRVWSVILMVIGLVIAILELKPTRVSRLRLRSADKATDAAVTRRGLAGALRAAATGTEGISAASVRVGRARARVTATTAARGRPAADALREPLTAAVRGRLDELELRHPPHLSVRVNTRRS